MELLIIIFVFVIIAFAIRSVIRSAKQDEREQLEKKELEDQKLIADAKRLTAMAELARQAKEHGDTVIYEAVMSSAYDGELPRKLADGGWEDLYAGTLRFPITGISFRENVSVGRFAGYIIPEPQNEHDPNALKVVTVGNIHVGYIPKVQTDDVRVFVGNKFPADAVIQITDFENDEGDTAFTGYVIVKRK